MAQKRTRKKVQDSPNLERDMFSNAILSKDSDGYKAALARKKNKNKMTSELDTIKSDIKELKELIGQLAKSLGDK